MQSDHRSLHTAICGASAKLKHQDTPLEDTTGCLPVKAGVGDGLDRLLGLTPSRSSGGNPRSLLRQGFNECWVLLRVVMLMFFFKMDD